MKDEKMKAMFLGMGLDGKDGHVRISRGENFWLYGGSEPTHEQMREKVIKFNEQLDKRGKQLENISQKEFSDIADKVGFKCIDPNSN